ncbi:glutaredoxin domain-containing protein [Ferrovibrio sp.]|uniref:glutaredoxin domain-containing protein n=1 Tax=Ferrovibrio sp. TaxID=1917215 RepID=UPI002615DFEF|nr:glutaredoxin domain-containing protein [Ferrovibrio sp.]
MAMKTKNPVIEIYTGPHCGYCERAKALLKGRALPYRELDISVPSIRQEMFKRLPRAKTIPQIFIDGAHVGGCEDLEHFMKSGGLDNLLGKAERR